MRVGIILRLGLTRNAGVSAECESVVVFVHCKAFAVVEILCG